jgi:type VI secretion system secreted protein Hcp
MASDNFLFFGTYPATEPAIAIGGNLTVTGETQDPDHKQALEIKEFSFGVENPTTIGSMSSGAGAGKAKFNEFNVKKGVDIASPVLFKACGLGCHFPTLQLIIRKAGGTKLDYLIYTFKMVFCTKVEWSGGAGEDAPDEDVTFVYGAMQITYTQQDHTGQALGTSEIAWSQVTNQPTLAVS